jgi:chromosome segregation ATPase
MIYDERSVPSHDVLEYVRTLDKRIAITEVEVQNLKGGIRSVLTDLKETRKEIKERSDRAGDEFKHQIGDLNMAITELKDEINDHRFADEKGKRLILKATLATLFTVMITVASIFIPWLISEFTK